MVRCPLVLRYVTPHIRSLFTTAQLRVGLPSANTWRCQPCPSASLRPCNYAARGLSPLWFSAMPGPHVSHQPTVNRKAQPRGSLSAGCDCYSFSYISLITLPKLSTFSQFVKSATVLGWVGPFVMYIIRRIVIRSKKRYF